MQEDYKLIIAGSRGWTDKELMMKFLKDFWLKFIKPNKIVIVSGMARGADLMGYDIAVETNTRIIRMPADWNTHGKAAGYIRNSQMAKIAHGALICWDGKSKGSLHMYDLASEHNLDTVIVQRTQPPPIVSFKIHPGNNYPGKE